MRDAQAPAATTSDADPYHAPADVEPSSSYEAADERDEFREREEPHSTEPDAPEPETRSEERERDIEQHEEPAAREPRRSYEETPPTREPAPPRRSPYQEPRRPSPPPERPRDFRPASPAAIAQAIEDVSQVVDSLRNALDEMEDVLECLELAERQKDADEQEIESLRRSLRQLHRPRDSGNRH